MREYASENMLQEIQDFFSEKGVKNQFGTLYEPWQDGLAKAETLLPETSVCRAD
jgi:hypothetical protein